MIYRNLLEYNNTYFKTVECVKYVFARSKFVYFTFFGRYNMGIWIYSYLKQLTQRNHFQYFFFSGRVQNSHHCLLFVHKEDFLEQKEKQKIKMYFL